MSNEIIQAQYKTDREIMEALLKDKAIPGDHILGDLIYMGIVGRDLGFTLMQSVRSMHLYKGKPILSSQGIQALVLKHPTICLYLQLVESTEFDCTYETHRAGNPRPTSLKWTIEMAQRAGLMGNKVWTAHPEAMLRARCVTALCRAVYPDLMLGIYETDEENEMRSNDLGLIARAEALKPQPKRPSKIVEEAPRPAPQLPVNEPAQLPEALHPAFAPEPGEAAPAVETISPFAAAIVGNFGPCTTLAQLEAKREELKGQIETLPDATRAQIGKVYKARKRALINKETATLINDIEEGGYSPEREQAVNKLIEIAGKLLSDETVKRLRDLLAQGSDKTTTELK